MKAAGTHCGFASVLSRRHMPLRGNCTPACIASTSRTSRMKRHASNSDADRQRTTKRQNAQLLEAAKPDRKPTLAVDEADAGAVPGSPPGELPRCGWATTYRGAGSQEYIRYHDMEWGRPIHNDKQLFELLVLEGAQAGLSWSTILAKRETYRAAFQGFDPVKVAAFDDSQVQRLLDEGSGVVRHKGKLKSAVHNAQVFLQLQEEHGSFDHYVWGFVPNRQPIVNNWTSLDQIPTKTPESEALSKALKKAGMSFVGPTTMYSFMQAAGLVNDHLIGCHCRQAIIGSYGRQQQQADGGQNG